METVTAAQKISTLIGCMFLLMPGGIDTYWGGIAVYALSFIAFQTNSNSQMELPLTVPLFFITWTPGILLSGLISERIGRAWLILLGLAISNIAAYSSYFAIQRSFVFFNIVLAGFGGLGTGITYGLGMDIVAHSAGKNVGLFTSLLMTSASIGSITITQLLTWYTNPENEVPTWKIGSTTYFTQRDIVDKVPSMFLVLGGLTTAMTVTGLISLFFGKALTFSKQKVKIIAQADVVNCPSSGVADIEEGYERETDNNDSACNILSIQDQDYTPKQMLKTATFYFVCLSFFVSEYASILVINYYKLFGQIWIKDDHFLSTVGTIGIFTVIIVRAVNGVALDTFGVRKCLLIILGSLTLVMSWFYFTAMDGPWVYLFSAILYFGAAGASYSTFFVSIPLLFGKTHVATNLGILMTFSAAFTFAVPVIIESILTFLGWFALFAIGSASNAVILVLCMFFMP